MSKTAPIPDDVHALIIDKQTELKRKHKVSVKISDIIALVMKNNINKVGKYLGLSAEEDIEPKKSIKEDIGVKKGIIENVEIPKVNIIDNKLGNDITNQVHAKVKNVEHSTEFKDGLDVKT